MLGDAVDDALGHRLEERVGERGDAEPDGQILGVSGRGGPGCDGSDGEPARQMAE